MGIGNDDMTGFSTIICRSGEPLPGTGMALPDDELAGLSGSEVSVFEDKLVVGSAVLVWDPNNKVLSANGKHSKRADRLKLRVEVLTLVKDKMDSIKPAGFDQDRAAGATAEDPDYDPTIPHRIVEVWYDLDNWVRYVWNETRARADRGQAEGWFPNYVAMDCVGEHDTPQLLSKDEFERTRSDCRARKAYCKVKEPRNEMHVYAEDALLVQMQAMHRAGIGRGKKKAVPNKMESEFEGEWK